MDSMKDLEKRFIAHKIRGIDIKAVNKSQFTEECTQYMKNILKESGLKLIDTLIECAEYSFGNISSKGVYFNMTLYFYLGFIVDDVFENNPKEAKKFAEYFTKRQCPGQTKIERLVQIYFRESKRLFSEDSLKELNQMTIEWLENFHRLKYFKSGANNFTEEEFFEMRFIDIHFINIFYFYALDTGLKLTEDVKNNQDYIGLNNEIIKDATLINDLFSFIKEVRDGKQQFNYLIVKMKNNHLSLEEAMDKVVLEINQGRKMIHHHAHNLMAQSNECLANYAKKVTHVVYGGQYWSQTCVRYFNDQLKFYLDNSSDINNNQPGHLNQG